MKTYGTIYEKTNVPCLAPFPCVCVWSCVEMKQDGSYTESNDHHTYKYTMSKIGGNMNLLEWLLSLCLSFCDELPDPDDV